jgi:3-phytase
MYYNRNIITLIIALQLVLNSFAQDFNRNIEAREDSLTLAKAYILQALEKNTVYADGETAPVESLNGEDAADDPAIWVNLKNPEKSLILGTNKKAGIYVYNLKGEVLQFVRTGNINNVDLRGDFIHNGKKMVLVAASNRSLNTISLYLLDKKTGILSDTISNISSDVDEVYGISMYHNKINGNFYAIVNGKGGKIEQWHIKSSDNKIVANRVKTFGVTTQPEGMVVDDESGMLYLGVEQDGIYYANLNSDTLKLNLIAESKDHNSSIVYDIEGLSLFKYKKETFLVASSQGNFTYAIFNTSKNCKYISSFSITENEIDGAEETDGLDITAFSCGKKYPGGILVAQDGFNSDNGKPVNQNFKIVSLSKIFPFLK